MSKTDDNWKVYVHINKLNNKRYVGVTSKPKVEHRWNSGRGYKENTHFYAAIQKYGCDMFDHIILYDGLSEEEAKNTEQYLISLWSTMDNKYGYNMTLGGQCCHNQRRTSGGYMWAFAQ